MKIRWKAGLTLAFLVSSFLFFSLIRDNSFAAGDQEGMFMYIISIMGYIIGVIVFLISLNFIDRKIKNNAFSYKRLFLLDLFMWFILTIFVEILGFFIVAI